jgi:hypothetical protein
LTIRQFSKLRQEAPASSRQALKEDLLQLNALDYDTPEKLLDFLDKDSIVRRHQQKELPSNLSCLDAA